MKAEAPTVVRYDSPEAAKLTTVEGWLSADGTFWPSTRSDAEHMARYCGCTHMPCSSCGTYMKRNARCQPCHEARQTERYSAFPSEPWDGTTFVADFDGDRYFSDFEELLDAVSEGEYDLATLRLVHCEANYPSQIDADDHFCDDLPEDGEVPDELSAAFDQLNAAIAKCGPLSWSHAKRAVELSPEQMRQLEESKEA